MTVPVSFQASLVRSSLKMWWLPAAGLYIDAHHEPPAYQSLLSGLDPVGDPPSGLKDWSWKPVSATAAAAAGPAVTRAAHTSAASVRLRRTRKATRNRMRSKLPRAPPPDAPLAH